MRHEISALRVKKLILLWIISLSTIISFTTAQNIWDIQASFCNENETNKELDIITKAGQETNICINFTNNSLKDTSILVNFVDWILTANGNKWCLAASKPKPNFGQHMLDYETKLNIPSNSTIQQIYKIKFPTGYSWVSHGCLSYEIDNKNNIAWWMGIIFRKSHTIDILVWWTEINSNLKIKDLSFSWDQVSKKLIFTIQNKWNISQSVQISGSINNPFWYSQNFRTETITIPANKYKTLETKNLNLPDYKWIFFVGSTLNYEADFNFNITNHNIPDQYTTPGTITISKTLILRNRFYIASIAIILSLITLIIFKHRR